MPVLRLALAALAFAAFSAGCVSVDTDAREAVLALSAGDDAKALEWSAELADDSYYSRNLGVAEAGRVNMLAGRYAEAERRFREAVDSAVDRSENSPRLKLGDIGNEAMASTVTDDRTRQYYLPPYEINMAVEYAILAQALNARPDEALVDARLAVYVQDTLAATYGADVAKEPDGSSDTTRQIMADQDRALEAMIAASRNSWENPLLWWLTGVMFEADGQLDMAWQSYRKAAVTGPNCPLFAADAARADKGATPARGKAKLVVVYDQGFVPRRESLKVPVPIYTGFSIDIPKYPDEPFADNRVEVAAATGATPAAPAVNVRSLAARDLKEKLPGVIVRNVTRAAVQAGAQAAVNASGNRYAQLAVFAGNMVVSALRSADVRSWATLPAAQQAWCADSLEPGTHEVRVMVNGRTVTARVPLAAGETRVLWLADLGGTMRGASASLCAKGAPPTDLNGKEITK